ncbi:MAG: hypothetical protein IT539_14965 [Bradyrhizobiaceae bacterium]|nr:hypothetical protein [Bradyrhizobiaceae bacterium]
MTVLRGTCHCGNVEVEFETSVAPADSSVRACQCSFCRRHGAKTTSDAAGRLVIRADEADIERYRFGFQVTDFVICRRCGAYIAAMSREGVNEKASLNVVGVGIRELAERDAAPVTLDHETAESRRERRRQLWTPVEIVPRTAVRQSA